MRLQTSSVGLGALSVLLGLSLAECAPLIGLDEDYHVAVRGGGGGQGGVVSPAGSGGVSAGSAGIVASGGGDGGTTVESGGAAGVDGGAPGAAGAGGLVIPPGKLVFHSYTTYETGDSAMYIVTFPEATVSPNLAETYELCNPVNGIFSPDGNWLAVTAEPPAAPCPATDPAQQDVYLLDLLNPGQKVKVTGNTVPDEDPQYSPDGGVILFKHNKHLAKWTLNSAPFTDCGNLSAGSACFASSTAEQSKPVMTPNGQDVCYYDMYGPDADILCFNYEAGLVAADINTIATRVVQHQNISDARPNFSDTHLYYVRWDVENNPIDRIARRALPDLQNATDDYPLFAVDLASDYSDPFSIDGDLVIFASEISGQGQHDLFIGRWESADDPQSLNQWVDVNTAKDELGPVFWTAPPP